MGRVSRILTGFFAEDDGKSGLYEKSDGTVWYRKPDGSEAEVGNGGSLPAGWTQDESGRVKTNGGFIRFDLDTPGGGFVVPNDGFIVADSAVSFDSGGDMQMGSQRVTGLPAPSSDTDASTKKYVDDLVSPLLTPDAQAFAGFAAHWFNSPGWTLADGAAWDTNEFDPTAIDWDPDTFADPGQLPKFSPIVPTGKGGMYLAEMVTSFSGTTAAGFVAANIAGSPGLDQGQAWAPVIYSDGTLQRLRAYGIFNLAAGSNVIDVAHFLNYSGHDVVVHRVDYQAVRLAVRPT